MTKLDGNERWKTKMMLTEHKEQFENRHDQKRSSMPTTEELTMVRDYILLPHMLTMVQKSIEDITHGPNLLKQLYTSVGQAVMNRISKDLYEIRRELTKRNIKIIGDEYGDMIVYHKLMCRGYEDRFGMTRDVMRSEISVKLKRYMTEVVGRVANEK